MAINQNCRTPGPVFIAGPDDGMTFRRYKLRLQTDSVELVYQPVRTPRCTKTQQAAQQSRYINRTATFERTASLSNVPLIDSTNASAAYVTIATSGDR